MMMTYIIMQWKLTNGKYSQCYWNSNQEEKSALHMYKIDWDRNRGLELLLLCRALLSASCCATSLCCSTWHWARTSRLELRALASDIPCIWLHYCKNYISSRSTKVNEFLHDEYVIMEGNFVPDANLIHHHHVCMKRKVYYVWLL